MKNIILFLSLALMMGNMKESMSKEPPLAPSSYDNGPNEEAPVIVDIANSEKLALALLEAMMQVVEVKIQLSSCLATAGKYPVKVISDTNFDIHELELLSFGGLYSLIATPFPGDQKIVIEDNRIGFFSGLKIGGFTSKVVYNDKNNFFTQNTSIAVADKKGLPHHFVNRAIMDLYNGTQGGKVGEIYGWGIQFWESLSYPVNKYWQRYKIHRGFGRFGKTVFVKDRLVGDMDCRITVDVSGTNDGEELFFQSGKLIVSVVNPSVPAAELIQSPFFP